MVRKAGTGMKSMMRRTTFREIRGSFGRYMAIFSIIALGVGFFAGLKVTRPIIVKIFENYTREQELFDYRALSTLGFEEEDVEAFRALPDVKAAEGALFSDVLYRHGEAEANLVASVHSITEDVNRLKLTVGRMPQEANECVVDADRFTEADIGTQILISEENKDETKDLLAYDSYTIVGVALSPTYTNFQRGSTSIGSGVINCFIYIPLDGFQADYYSEIYLTMNVEEALYSQEYDDYVAAHESAVEETLRIQTKRRQDAIRQDAQDEIDAAQEELDSESAAAWAELTKAKNDLDAAQDEITAGSATLQETKAELEAALEQQRTGLQEQLSAAQAGLTQIAQQETELAQAQQAVDDGRAEYEKGLAEYEAQMADGQSKIDDAQEELDSMEDASYYLLDRGTNVGYVCFENDSNIVEEVAKVFPVFFFLVAVLVCMTTMNRMIEEQRTQIGVLKALGYSNAAIMGKYMVYSGSAAIAGCIFGFAVGTYVFPKVIWYTYGLMYSVSGTAYLLDMRLALISLVVSLLCSVGTTWMSCRIELGSVAAELIRPKAPKSGKRILLERIPFLWKHLKFLYKVSLRNIFRYKKRFFMMVFGISGCTALVIAGLGLHDSIVDVVDVQYGQIQIYDMNVTFKDPLNEEEQQCFVNDMQDTVADILYHMTTAADVSFEGKTKSVTVMIPKPGSELDGFLTLLDDKGRELPYPSEGEAVISQGIAKRLKITSGDTVTFMDDDMNRMEVTISGVCDNYVGNYLYLTADTYEKQTGDMPAYRGAWCHVRDGVDAHEAGTRVMEDDRVGSVSVTQDMVERVRSMLTSLNYIIVLVIGCAAALAFIVLYNLTNINITERLREIATIKVLGFYPGETAAYVFRENLLLTAIGALAGLGLGKWLHGFIMHSINVDGVSFQTKILPVSYLAAVVLTFVFAMIVNAFMYFKLQKIDMAESLKSIE